MDETSKYLLELSVTLVLVVLLATLSYLWLRGRKELGHLRQLFDQLPDPVLRVELVSFKPLICNRAFSSLLGYADNLECVSQFTRYPHLPQQNFYQIYRLSQEAGANLAAETGTNILFQDRQGNRVDYQQLVVQLDTRNRYMDIVLEQSGSYLTTQEPDSDLGITQKRDETPCEEIQLQQNDVTNSFLDSLASDLLDEGYGFWELNHRTGLIVHSESWLDYLGYGAATNTDELSFWLSIISPNNRDDATRAIQPGGKDEPYKIQYKIASGTGIEFDIETRGLVVERDADDNPVLSRGIHIDVTRSNVNGLNREAHHQLMNQVAAILGYADMIHANENVPIEVKGFTQEIVTNGEAIRDLLVPVGQNKPDSSTSIEKIAARHKLDVTGDTILQSNIAEGDLEEVINLVLQYTMNESNGESNCKLMITEPVDPWCSACNQEIRSSNVCLVVEQNGIHIERKHFLHLLEPGFMTSSVGGKNLLLGASELLHEQGGHISLTLTDPGLAVALYLPEHVAEPYVPELKLPGRETANGLAGPVAGKAASTGRNILIIDDEISVANYLKKIVSRAGYEATVFTDSGAALEHFKHRADQFDLVITDQTMPGLSGDVVMQSMLEQNPKLPIIVCTGFRQTIDSAAAYNAGAAGFVTKPVRVAHLMQTINRAMGSVQ